MKLFKEAFQSMFLVSICFTSPMRRCLVHDNTFPNIFFRFCFRNFGEAILGTQRYFAKHIIMFLFSQLWRGDFRYTTIFEKLAERHSTKLRKDASQLAALASDRVDIVGRKSRKRHHRDFLNACRKSQ